METRRTAGEEDGRQADESKKKRMKYEEVSALGRIEQPAPGSPSLLHL